MESYKPEKIEKKWQKIWSRGNFSVWKTKNSSKKSVYILDFFPYPSGEGLHVGHIEGYTGTDILSRYYRMRGYNVLHPMGWDAFGLPAENYAIKMRTNPMTIVPKNIAHFKEQLQAVGISYDWDREINTTDPKYYKWTQWIFLQLYKAGLAYEAEGPINWCPSCKTGLSNEDLEDGRCERCKTIVETKNLRQWYLRITAYADRLLDDLKDLAWPENVKEMQRNWIGKKHGAEVSFKVKNKEFKLKVFTTRPETIFGATFIALSPDHELSPKLADVNFYSQVERYLELTKHGSAQNMSEKTGVFTGSYAINPLSGIEVPIWISNYVLSEFGTGAVMGVPAHDKRDYEFAQKFRIPIIPVIESSKTPFEGEGILINSEEFSKIHSSQAKTAITHRLKELKIAEEKTTYRLKDWLFSRQRYWGEPIPIIKCAKCGALPVPEKDLPVELPKVKYYEPTGTGESPLINIKEWVNVKCPKCKGPAKRETNTMPQWAGSSWYYLRFIDPKNTEAIADKDEMKKWLPVTFYVGGVEHATRHLIYARFWHKFLYDIGAVPTKEPFGQLVNPGIILGPDHEKMSKSRGNIVTQDTVIKTYGTDSLRLFEMFSGPFEITKPWSDAGVIGVKRFLERAWNIVTSQKPTSVKEKDKEFQTLLQKTVFKVTDDIEHFRFNTAVSSLMILQRELAWRLSKSKPLSKQTLETFIILLSPFAPHIAEELWAHLGHKQSVQKAKWPEAKMPKEISAANYQIQINGKTRLVLSQKPGLNEETLRSLVVKNPKISKYLKSKKIKKLVYIQNKLLNFVV